MKSSLGVTCKIDEHLNWNNHIDFLIDKLNSRICLLIGELRHILIIGKEIYYTTH